MASSRLQGVVSCRATEIERFSPPSLRPLGPQSHDAEIMIVWIS
jgi:hypothetical protein